MTMKIAVLVPLLVLFGVLQNVLAESTENCTYAEKTYRHNSVTTFTCPKNYQLVGNSQMKCSFGKWEGKFPECIFITVKCHLKDVLYQDHVSLKTPSFVLSGNTLNIVCEEGYSASSEKPLCENGSWKQRNETLCKKTENCTYAEKTYRHNSVTPFTCPKNYKLVGNPQMKCSFGKWEGKFPECIFITDKCHLKHLLYQDHVSLKTPSFVLSGNTLNIVCDEGYSASSEKPLCEKGSWNQRNETLCKKTENCTYDEKTYRHNSVTRFTCPKNYKLVGNSQMKCSFGKWEGKFPECIFNVTCSFFTSDGVVQIGYLNSNKTGSVAIFTCPFYANLVGAMRSTCQRNGSWNSPLPKCIDITCPFFSTDKLIKTTYSNSNKFSSIAKFSCPNYTNLIGAYNSTCRHNGSWSSPLPQCKDITCPFFSNDNAINITYLNGNKVASAVKFSCPSYANLVGEEFSVCLPHGSWNYPIPQCVNITCPFFSTDKAVNTTYSNSNKVGSVAKFRCPISTNLVGANYSTCQQNSSWNSPPPRCVDITCPFFYTDKAINTTYSNSNKVGSVAKFRCPISTNLVGANYSTCQQNSSWNSPPPQCVDVTCPFFTSGGDVNITLSNSNKVGSVAKFSCPIYANLIGASNSTCQQDGSWDSPLPHCDDFVICPELPISPDLSVVYSKGVSVNSIAVFSCSSSTTLIGKTYAICQNNGTWSSSLPSCEGTFSGCALERNSFSYLQIEPEKQRYQFGESVLLSCPPFKELIPKVERMVCMGEIWSDEIPDCKEKT